MPRQKPHVVVFFGGENPGRDLSTETGYWACQYVPRGTYQVTPVHVRADGLWQVPLGSLPQRGPVGRMMSMMFKSVKAVTPAEGIQKLLRRPVHALMSLMRGKGGDDGSMKSMGQNLKIPVMGPGYGAYQQTFDKHLFNRAVDSVVSTPYSLYFPANRPIAQVVAEIREEMVPPLFIKPAAEEGSIGVEEVLTLDDLWSATKRAKRFGGAVLAQEKLRGHEISITLLENEPGKITALSPTTIVPRTTTYYDQLAKRKPGRVLLQQDETPGKLALIEAETIARDVWDELGLTGTAVFDLIANDDGIYLLETNTIPTFSNYTPLKYQLEAAGMHPNTYFDQLIRRGLERGY